MQEEVENRTVTLTISGVKLTGRTLKWAMRQFINRRSKARAKAVTPRGNRKLDEQIMKLENTDIIGMVREIGMTPEQLAALLRDRQAIAPKPEDMRETEEYEE